MKQMRVVLNDKESELVDRTKQLLYSNKIIKNTTDYQFLKFCISHVVQELVTLGVEDEERAA